MASILSWNVDLWPLSLAKFLDYYTIIFRNNANKLDILEAYCGTNDIWVATANESTIVDFDPVADKFPVNIDIADFGWFYALTYVNSASTVWTPICYQRVPGESSGASALTAIASAAVPDFLTCCNFKGQGILGGIVSTNASWTQLGSASVCWSGIGNWEFRPATNKTAGYLKMPWSDWDEGVVNKVAHLGKGVLVLGNGGRAGLQPFSQGQATGFGMKPFSGAGITKGFHHAGDEDIQCFIDTNNELWVVDGGFKFQKLGYKEWIDAMQVENDAVSAGLPIIVSHSPKDKRFYICGNNSSYVLTEFGLYSTHQSTSNIGRYRGGVLTGFVKDVGDYQARVAVDDKDFRVRGLKTIDVVEYAVDYPSRGSGAELAAQNCCTDENNDVDVTTGWTAGGDGSPSIYSVASGVTGNRLKIQDVAT